MARRKIKQNKNNLFRFKLEHEEIPIVDQKSNSFKSIKSLFKEIEKKFEGGSK